MADIWDYIAERDSFDPADTFLTYLEQRCQRLAKTPRIGREQTEISPDTFFFPVGNYVIAYLITDYGIHVVRIVHAAQDFPALF
jgi:toxin ParE1/3/4